MVIDRHALVSRHNPRYTAITRGAPLSVGNGTFCFTADFTGLQTFFDAYNAADDSFPLCTMAEWGWHSYPDAPADASALRLTPFDTFGRTVGYPVDPSGQEELFRSLRQNPHKFHLGIIGFTLDNAPLSLAACTACEQTLDLWTGRLSSRWTVASQPVRAETFVHPWEDTLYVRVVSPLIAAGKLRVSLRFPYGSHTKSGADFTHSPGHSTALHSRGGELTFERVMDGVRYRLRVRAGGISLDGLPGTASLPDHTFTIDAGTGRTGTLALAFCFEPMRIPVLDTPEDFIKGGPEQELPSFSQAEETCRAFWEGYWTAGGALDLSASTDRRAGELERRLVLSQYLMAIQNRGIFPPAETGLSCNSWYGKFHLEMHFWHSAHFALWGRAALLKKSLAFYRRILPVARCIAASQGYTGARWPKMCDPRGFNAPSSIAVLLLWQQPHPIMLAELCYRAAPEEAFLREYRDVVLETAQFMESFIHWEGGRAVLAAPYIPAQERHDPKTILNAPYELEYFRWALKQVDGWLARLGEGPCFGETAERLALPPQKDGLYLAAENCPDTFRTFPFYTDHPAMLAMYGVLASEKVDPPRMSATLDKVLEVWDWESLWGWDFPMMAMTAYRLGRLEDALDILLRDSPKNTYLPNGHNKQSGSDELPLYLPGNGGLLLALGMMATDTRGFPPSFNVQAEGMLKVLP
ncbi:MAG: hypothetical protein LBC60_01755 [Spirochaetaceae bacterium]|jgi:hypothetical protein|nr:hypothetical protein [Spirochaetaceae bacterium]